MQCISDFTTTPPNTSPSEIKPRCQCCYQVMPQTLDDNDDGAVKTMTAMTTIDSQSINPSQFLWSLQYCA